MMFQRWQRKADEALAWLRLRQMAQRVAREARPDPAQRPVVFFNASTRIWGLSQNAAFQLLTAWSLRLQGVPVVQFVCRRGMSRCILGADPDDPAKAPPCDACMRHSGRIYTAMPTRAFTFRPHPGLDAALEGLGVEALQAFAYEGVPLGALVLPGLRWRLRRHTLHDDETTRTLYREFIRSAWQVAQDFAALLDETQPQAVVVFNGQFFPEATARWVAQQRGIRVLTHEVGLRPLTAYFTEGEATAYPIAIPDDFDLTPAQNARLDAYLSRRFQGEFTMAGIRFWPEMRGLDEGFLRRAEGFRQIVPVFTNVIFDTSQPHANVVFPHMFAWLDAVLEIIRAHPETLFVIRAHPDEQRPGKAARESVREWVQRRGVADLPNVVFVDSQEFLNSYDLIRRAKFVMVYNSTIGLEAVLLGKAVLCGGKARFTQYPIVFFPQTPEAYRGQAEAFLRAPGDEVPAPPEFRRNARRFLYYQLYKVSLPFDAFLQEHPWQRGYVRLKPFAPEALLPENSATMRVLRAGILEGGALVLPDDAEEGG